MDEKTARTPKPPKAQARPRKSKNGLDRQKLQADLLALYHQYRSDAEHAAQLQAEYDRLSKNVETLLDEEFPGWKQPGADEEQDAS